MFVFYGTKSRKEVEILKYDIIYREGKKFYLRYGIIAPEVRTSKAKTIGFYINKDMYVKSKGMECIDFEDFIRFIK
ncbi:MAG: hypothetical protein MSA89_04245 [Clostridium sp.]|nr:hypothetical protein [Clostridium sp.]